MDGTGNNFVVNAKSQALNVCFYVFQTMRQNYGNNLSPRENYIRSDLRNILGGVDATHLKSRGWVSQGSPAWKYQRPGRARVITALKRGLGMENGEKG